MLHTVIETAENELCILFDKENMTILDMRNAQSEKDKQTNTFNPKDVHCHESLNIQSL